MRGFGGDDGGGGGLRICITSCRTCTMADSCTSNRAVSFLSSAASFFASWGLAESASRILRNARTTKTLICTACGLLRTFAAMIAPCSVKAYGSVGALHVLSLISQIAMSKPQTPQL
jgi:hypothetical protein